MISDVKVDLLPIHGGIATSSVPSLDTFSFRLPLEACPRDLSVKRVVGCCGELYEDAESEVFNRILRGREILRRKSQIIS